MRTFIFDSFMSYATFFRENNVQGFTDEVQEPDVILSGLSLSGYTITLEGAIMSFLFLFGVYTVLEHIVRLLPQERFRLAIGMAHWANTSMVLLRNRLEEICESGVSEETCLMLRPVLEHAERIIVCNRNTMQLDRSDWKAVSEARIAEVEIHGYVRTVVDWCRPYADSRHIQLEISRCEDCASCKINEAVMTAAIQCLLSKMIDITSPGGCIHITASYDTGFWKLEAANCRKTEKKAFTPLVPVLIYSDLRTVDKIIRLHGGKMVVHRFGKSAVYQIAVPADCHCRNKENEESVISPHKQSGHRDEEITDFNGKEGTYVAGNLPRILLVMTDNLFRNYLQTALSGEFNISLRETLDIEELASIEEKPDAIVIDENLDGTCGDELCSRIKAEEMTAVIPVILLVEYDDSRSYLSHARSGANRLELRTVGICRLRADIHMLINSCILLRKQANRMLATTVHILPEIVEKEEDSLVLIHKVRKLLEENLATEGYTIEKLCGDVGMSRTGFYNRIKELTGKTPQEYMLAFKMERAKVLLASGRYSVTEIAEMLGYCDAKYFGKKFKGFYHTCPTKFANESIS